MVTKLELIIDDDVWMPCNSFRLPQLRTFTYETSDFVATHHTTFSILHSCQGNLKELYAKYDHRVDVVASRTNTHQLRESRNLIAGYNEWKNCEICCQNSGEFRGRALHLEKLVKYQLYDYKDGGMAKLLHKEKIVMGTPTTTLYYGVGNRDLRLVASAGNKLDIHSLFSHRTGCPSTREDFEGYFQSTTGLEAVDIEYTDEHQINTEVANDSGEWGWMHALQKNHSHSLKGLVFSNATRNPTDGELSSRELENVGRALPNLEELTVYLLKSLPMVNVILNKHVFPALKTFHNGTIPSVERPELTRVVRKQVLGALTEGLLPPGLALINLCSRKYVIDRRISDQFRSKVSFKGQRLFRTMDIFGLMDTEARLKMYDIKVKELPY
ncbi:hypothetical protein TWF730_004564 [Orbilia blumenaviensis]|uniref:Uncharacterized protein n=1 Tax=Orbilia blumenaviensis TaxID=1796055 RepID=A0AAV9U0W5_9PEZI